MKMGCDLHTLVCVETDFSEQLSSVSFSTCLVRMAVSFSHSAMAQHWRYGKDIRRRSSVARLLGGTSSGRLVNGRLSDVWPGQLSLLTA